MSDCLPVQPEGLGAAQLAVGDAGRGDGVHPHVRRELEGELADQVAHRTLGGGVHDPAAVGRVGGGGGGQHDGALAGLEQLVKDPGGEDVALHVDVEEFVE